jgi:integrase
MTFSVAMTKRVRKRTLSSGEAVQQQRYVLNYIDPQNGKRRQEFFERQKDAQSRKNALVVQFGTGTYRDERTVPTVSEAIDHWLEDKRGKVKANTFGTYEAVVENIRGPLLVASRRVRADYTMTGKAPPNAKFLPLLGKVKISDLSTAEIRSWHRLLSEHTGVYSAKRAKALLTAVLALAEEDYGVRAASMPSGLGRATHKPKKVILAPGQIAHIIQAARQDAEHGTYYAFPFLAGTRPSEQLGLLWQEIDFERNIIRICRIQERDGSLTEMTKTAAGTRDIPMSAILREMLLAWRLVCPRQKGVLHRVFPGPGRLQPWPMPRLGGGGPILYQNFRIRFWQPAFKRLGLPYVTPHSAWHSFISTLQAQGIEVGLVAKLAGHSSAAVTLSHYTQAVRGGEGAVAALDEAYRVAG